MAKLKITDEWWTAPAESEDGKLILVTGRRNMDEVIATQAYKVRVEVTWKYDGGDMPNLDTSTTMEEVTDALKATFAKDPVAVMTGIYTGAGERNWVFYTKSLNIFGKKLNEALAQMPLLPITLYAENDVNWEEYLEMRETEIPDEE